MQFLNFSLGGQNIDLEWPAGGYADLHNNFDFTALHFEPSQARLRLSWQKSTGEWARQEPWVELHLLFESVSFLRIKERDPEYPLTEDDCLAYMSLMPPSERDDFDSTYFFPKDYDTSGFDLLLSFQSEWGLKVNAATVRLELVPLTA